MYAEYATGFAYAGLRSRRGNVAVPEFREILAQQFGKTEYIFAKLALCAAEIAVIGRIGCPAGDINCHAALAEHIVEPRAAEVRDVGAGFLEGQQLLAYGTALARAVDTVVVHAFVEQLAVGVHARKYEAE